MLRYIYLITAALILAGCGAKSSIYRTGPVVSATAGARPATQATMRPYTINGKTYYPTVVSIGQSESGIASWYGPDFHGKKTSNGEIYNMNALTAAHKTLPMNTMVRVTNKNNGRIATVRINDRGPFVAGRIIDLSKAAATQIGMINTGTAPVKLDIIGFYGATTAQNSVKSPAAGASANTGAQGSQSSITGGGFLVQIAAFKRAQGAQTYKTQHASVGSYHAIVKEGYLADGSAIYRVYLSGFRSEAEARDFAASSQYKGAFVVRE